MKQVVQNYKTGAVTLEEVPAPLVKNGCLLVRNHRSLISLGTERSTIELGKKSLLGKAKSRPDLVKRALEKAKKEGFIKTFQEAMGRLDLPTPLGYSSAGIVEACADNAHGFAPGDRVACIGQGIASHAEYIIVPQQMACKIPDNVSDDAAAFSMLGIIALHGIRKADLSFGSTVVVTGLGLLGLLSVQLLKAYGCRVLAIDPVAEKVALAKTLGADYATSNFDELLEHLSHITHEAGADAVVLTMATKSDQPVNQAVDLSRNGGKIVVVGVGDIHPDRNELWQKEVEIVVSKTAGPGSLDPLYEFQGIDYPMQYARWSQQRNLEEFLRLLSIGAIDTQTLITHRFAIEAAADTYADLIDNKIPGVIGALFEYTGNSEQNTCIELPTKATVAKYANVAVIGAGLFGKALLIPALSKVKEINLHTLITSSGMNAQHNAKKFGFANCATDMQLAFEDNDIQTIVALTPHSTHARIVNQALSAGKHLFIEKPLCTEQEELKELRQLVAESARLPVIFVGHNRRYSPHAQKMKTWLQQRTLPLVLTMRINSGHVPHDHWVHTDQQGRSRIVGEMSHFIDLMVYLVGANPISVYAERCSADDKAMVNNDNVIISLKFADGSIANLTYTAAGYKGFSREHTEIFFAGKTIVSTDFKLTEYYSEKGKQKLKTMGQEMGYKEELEAFFDMTKTEHSLQQHYTDMFAIMQVIFAIEASLANKQVIDL